MKLSNVAMGRPTWISLDHAAGMPISRAMVSPISFWREAMALEIFEIYSIRSRIGVLDQDGNASLA